MPPYLSGSLSFMELSEGVFISPYFSGWFVIFYLIGTSRILQMAAAQTCTSIISQMLPSFIIAFRCTLGGISTALV